MKLLFWQANAHSRPAIASGAGTLYDERLDAACGAGCGSGVTGQTAGWYTAGRIWDLHVSESFRFCHVCPYSPLLEQSEQVDL